MFGWAGSILRIDLSAKDVVKEPLPGEWARKFLGGEGINSWILLNEMAPHIDPLSPDNLLVLGIGPLGGGISPFGSKTKVTFKSPAYHLFGDSAMGGLFGSMMKWAGYDHLVIRGKAEKPTYIWINDDDVEFRDATHLWGKDTWATQDLIREELGDKEVAVACIGQGGENLVRYASIVCDRYRVAARCGGGCVMGSKKLKAIAVKGTKPMRVAHPREYAAKVEELSKQLIASGHHAVFSKYGTPAGVRFYNVVGCHGTRNYQDVVYNPPSSRGSANNLSAEFLVDNFGAGHVACSPSCITHCSHRLRVRGHETAAAPKYAGERSEKLDFVIIASFGILCDNDDLASIIHLQNLINRYGVDSIELGSLISFFMELKERGIISEKDSDGINYSWGNIEAIEETVSRISLGQGRVYELGHEGVYKAAAKLGGEKGLDLTRYAVFGKGGSPHCEDVRATPAWALAFAVSPRGADHLKGAPPMEKEKATRLSQEIFGHPGAGWTYKLDLKSRLVAWQENVNSVVNSLGCCTIQIAYCYHHRLKGIKHLPELFTYATGMAMDEEEMLLAGERVCNVEKAFNTLLGYDRKDDNLCPRWLEVPCPSGPGQGMKCEDYLEGLKDEYYLLRGWDVATGLQTRKRLEELDLEDVATRLEEAKMLAPFPNSGDSP